jgi:hypothetical protein
LRQIRDLTEIKQTVENLLTALAGMNLKAGEITKKALILAGQLEETSLFLVIIREEEAAMVSRVRYIICRLITL